MNQLIQKLEEFRKENKYNELWLYVEHTYGSISEKEKFSTFKLKGF